jgi:serine/threonine protein kinase
MTSMSHIPLIVRSLLQSSHLICIPRDLKPDNALVTEFTSSKISDFGTSRSKAQSYQDVAMTAVGTPLFCAPEVLNGEVYDEKVRTRC